MKDPIKEQILLENSLHFIRVTAVTDPEEEKRLDKEYEEYTGSFLDESDKCGIAGLETDKKEVLMFLFIHQWKVERIISFIQEHNLLAEHKIVDDPVRFFCSDKELFEAYNNADNRDILDVFIRNQINVDYVLDRYNENRNVPGFTLLPVEMEVFQRDAKGFAA